MATATRARRGTKAAVKPAEEESAESNSTVREPSEMHELMADFFNENYEAGVTPRQCAIYTSKRGEFRRSAEYLEYRERNAANGGDEEAEAEKPAARPARRGRKAAAEEAEPEAEEAPKAAPARRPRRGAAKAATEETETETAEKAAPARRRRSRPAAVSEEEPF